MSDRKWKLGEDVHAQDNLLDGFTFQQVIDSLHAGEQIIDEGAVYRVVGEMVKSQMQDLKFLVDNNLDTIIAVAKKGR